MGNCPLCDYSAESAPIEKFIAHRITCPVCGTYKIDDDIASDVDGLPKNRRYILSGVVRRSSDLGTTKIITYDNVTQLLDSVVEPDGPLAVLDNVLTYIADNSGDFYAPVKVEPAIDYPTAFARNALEFERVVINGVSSGLIKQNVNMLSLSTTGYERVKELRKARPESRQAFVAMWFDKALNPAYGEGLKPALEEANYVPLRIDQEEFSDKIDDKVIAEIRRSGLVVADVTGHRPAVYFEAGFAKGLGIPIIWTCREDDLNKASFDTRQYNHIVWQNEEDLRKKLLLRLLAEFPTQK